MAYVYDGHDELNCYVNQMVMIIIFLMFVIHESFDIIVQLLSCLQYKSIFA